MPKVIKAIITLTLFFWSSVSSNKLSRTHINFTVYHNPPYDIVKRDSSGNYSHTGSTANVAAWLAKKFNLSFTTTPVAEELLTKLGPNEASFYTIINKGADCSLNAFIVSPDRKKRMDFTFMTWTEPYTLVVPNPEPEHRLFAFIRPFQPMVWFFLAIGIVFIVGMMSLFSWILQNNRHKKSNKGKIIRSPPEIISFYIVYIINILTNHGIEAPHAHNSFRILAGCWLLGALVLVNSYSSIVVSSLTLPRMKAPINSFEDLAANKEDATSGVLQILGNEVRQHPDRVVVDMPSVFKKLEMRRYAFPFLRTFNYMFVANQFKKDGKCRFRNSDSLPSISTGYFCLLLQKDSMFTSYFSSGLVQLWETGLARFWVEKQVPRADQCFVRNEKAGTSAHMHLAAIKLEDLTSAFFILGIGISLALFTFVIEISAGKLLAYLERANIVTGII